MTPRNFIKKLSLVCLITLAAACGGKSSKTTTSPSSLPPIPNTGITTGGNGSSSSGGSNHNGTPAISYTYEVVGKGSWVSPVVSTDNLLKVRVIPGPAGTFNNFTANYNCQQLVVRLEGTSLGAMTRILSVSGGSSNCPGAPADELIDLSAWITPGHGDLKLKVDTISTDFYCQYCHFNPALFQYNCGLYCPVRAQYDTHVATGTIRIQVNGLGEP